jgi:hypothetical protein
LTRQLLQAERIERPYSCVRQFFHTFCDRTLFVSARTGFECSR